MCIVFSADEFAVASQERLLRADINGVPWKKLKNGGGVTGLD
jgi:hypothetical protein